MAELTAELFKEYFEGRWTFRVSRNGELVLEMDVDWHGEEGTSAQAVSKGLSTPPAGKGNPNDLDLKAAAGWQSDAHRWSDRWYNALGGYGELVWTSQGMLNGVKVLYGTLHECEKDGDDPADYIAMCELFDADHFKYTVQCYRKGILEIAASRVADGRELTDITRKAAPGKQKRSAAAGPGGW